MMKGLVKGLSVMSTAALVAALVAGCSGEKEVDTVQSMPDIEFPLAQTETLTYWTPIQISNCTNLNDTELYKELEKRTGVKVEMIHPARGQEKDQLNIMIASNELPDIIEGPFSGYPGGGSKAVKSGLLVSLNKYMDKYAPNYKKVLSEHADVDKEVKTDDGDYYKFASLRETPEMAIFSGPILRGDWLKQLNLEVPETIDDWEKVLTAFKTIPGVEAPFTIRFNAIGTYRAFMGAYGVGESFYRNGDEIVFGPMQDGYKEYLTTMNKWYKAGLIDHDFATLDSKTIDAKMTTGKSGATFAGAGGGIGKYTKILAENGGYMVGADYPVLNKGEVSEFGQGGTATNDYGTAYITGQCKNIPLAIKWLDYGYSDEGQLLYNFGIEGKSYSMVDGLPTYSEAIMTNKEGLANALAPYARGAYNGPFVQAERYIEQYYEMPEQKEAWARWSKTKINDHAIDSISYTTEESSEISSLKSDIDTYVSEMSLKFIIGVEPIENFDSFVAQLEKMGIKRYQEIVQQAYDRFKTR